MGRVKKKVEPDFDDLPELTPKQRKFVEGLVAGMSASEAYRAAYDTSGYSTRQAVWIEASKLKSSPKVSLYMAALRKAGFAQDKLTIEAHLQRLAELSQQAADAGQYSAAIQAEQNRGKAQGLYIERTLDMSEGVDDQTLIKIIQDVLGTEAATVAATKLGLTNKDIH